MISSSDETMCFSTASLIEAAQTTFLLYLSTMPLSSRGSIARVLTGETVTTLSA